MFISVQYSTGAEFAYEQVGGGDAALILLYAIGGWRASKEELRRCATIAFTKLRHDRRRLATN